MLLIRSMPKLQIQIPLLQKNAIYFFLEVQVNINIQPLLENIQLFKSWIFPVEKLGSKQHDLYWILLGKEATKPVDRHQEAVAVAVDRPPLTTCSKRPYSVLLTGWLFGHITQRGPNKK